MSAGRINKTSLDLLATKLKQTSKGSKRDLLAEVGERFAKRCLGQDVQDLFGDEGFRTVMPKIQEGPPWRENRKQWRDDMAELKAWYAQVGLESESSDPLDSSLSSESDSQKGDKDLVMPSALPGSAPASRPSK